MSFKPLRDIVLISKQAPEKVTSGGIVLTGVTTQQVTRARVEAIGPGYVAESNGQFVPTCTNVGDLVIIPPGAGHAISIPGYGESELFIIRESEIAGVLSE